MVDTFGHAHISLAVRDPLRSLDFYAQVFGVRAYCREPGRQFCETTDAGGKWIVAFDGIDKRK